MFRTIERRCDRVGAASLILSGVFTLLLDLFPGGSPLRGWLFALARDAALLLAASSLLVFGLRSLRRSGASRFGLLTTAGGAVIFLGLVGINTYAMRTLESAAQLLRSDEYSEVLDLEDSSARELQEQTAQTIDALEQTLPRLHRALAFWSSAGILCVGAGLATPIGPDRKRSAA